jgi:hypothetical protein
MTQFSRDSLPCLGVTWTRFATLREARRFAAWAERETKRDQYPCEAFVTEDNRNDPGETFEVKVRNW